MVKSSHSISVICRIREAKLLFCLKLTPVSTKLAAGYKESQLYSFPFGQAEASMY